MVIPSPVLAEFERRFQREAFADLSYADTSLPKQSDILVMDLEW
jgi:hypothetical protein